MYQPLEKKHKIHSYNIEAEELFFQTNANDKFTVFTKEYSTQIDNEVFGNSFYWNDYLVFSNVNKKKSSFWLDGKEVIRKDFHSHRQIGDYLISSCKKEKKNTYNF